MQQVPKTRFPDGLARASSRLGMHLQRVDYPTASALVEGYNLAVNGGLLFGFREWLIVKANGGNNLAWSQLVLEVAFPEVALRRAALQTQEGNDKAVNAMFNLLDDFLAFRSRPEGAREVFLTYERWLRRQAWYEPSSPVWFEL